MPSWVAVKAVKLAGAEKNIISGTILFICYLKYRRSSIVSRFSSLSGCLNPY